MEYPFPIRKIIHIDMDAFFASVEQRDFPDLRGKPIIVGGGHRGVVAAASYEARKFGIRSAMPARTAFEKCPQLIAVPPRFDRYKEVSNQIRKIFLEYTDLVQPLSIDEAFLDVTENKVGNPMAHVIAKEIRQKIYEQTSLTASAGISINKFLAKIASDINKPNGQKTIHPSQVIRFLEDLPIDQFYGIGKVTARRMHEMAIYTGKDLKSYSKQELIKEFGKAGEHYYLIVRGIQYSEVEPNRIRKSISTETTFDEDIDTTQNQSIFHIMEELVQDLDKRTLIKGILGKTLTLKIKYGDFTLFTRSKTITHYFTPDEMLVTLHNLWYARPYNKPVRLLGVGLSNLNTTNRKTIITQLQIPFSENAKNDSLHE